MTSPQPAPTAISRPRAHLILDILRSADVPLRTSQILTELGSRGWMKPTDSPNIVTATLAYLMRRNEVRRVGHGHYVAVGSSADSPQVDEDLRFMSRSAAVVATLDRASCGLTVERILHSLQQAGRPDDQERQVREVLYELVRHGCAVREGELHRVVGGLPSWRQAPTEPGERTLGETVLALLSDATEPMTKPEIERRLFETERRGRDMPRTVSVALHNLKKSGKARTVGRGRWIRWGDEGRSA